MNDANARIKQAGNSYPFSRRSALSSSLSTRSSVRKKVQERGKGCRRGTRSLHQSTQRHRSRDVPGKVVSLCYVCPAIHVSDHPGPSSNHALHVTQQNTLVTFNVAASLAHIADAEWTRTCESMRRISPTIGSLGEWRSLCEGAWSGPLPDDLPDVSSEAQVPIPPGVSEWGQTGLSTPLRRSLPVPPATSHSPGSVSVSATSSLDPPHSPFATPTQNQNQHQGSVNSITTLSAFPFPPTHFPVPLATSEAELQRQQTQLQNLQSVHSRAGSPNITHPQGVLAPPTPILTDSQKQIATASLPEPHAPDTSRPSSLQIVHTLSTSHQSNRDVRDLLGTEPSTVSPADRDAINLIASGADPKKPRRPSLIARVPPPSTRPASPFKRAEHSPTENEFGVHVEGSASTFKSHSVDGAKKHLERTDSTLSTENNVAALRNKYIRKVGTSLLFYPLHIHFFFFLPRLKPRHKDRKMSLGYR